MPRERRVDRGIPDHQKSLYALGAAFATYGVAVGLPPEGNGLIAVFVCAIVLGIRRPDLRETFERARGRHRRDRQARRVRRVRLAADARRPVRRRLGGRRARRGRRCWSRGPWRSWSRSPAPGCPRALKAFMAWFGPKGVATMTFSLLVLSSGFEGDARIFNLAALCVFVSILAHGLTDTPGVGVDALGVQRRLLLSRRERPRGLAAALLAEDEAQLARRPQPLRMVGAERRAGLVECECAQSVAPEEAIVATHLPRLHVPCCQLPPTPPSRLDHRTSGKQSAPGSARATPEPANRTLFGASPQIPANGPKTSLPAGSRPRILGGFRAPARRGRCADAILVTGVSGYVGAALAPALAARRPRRARLRALARARGGGRRGARRARDRRRADRRGARRGDGRRRGRLLPDPLDGGRGRRRVPRAGARAAPSASPPPRRRPACAAIVYLGGLVPRDGRRLAPPRLAARRRGGAARRARPSRSRCAPRS